MDEDGDGTPWGVAIGAIVVSVIAILIASGSCGFNERTENRLGNKIDHLEERLDVHLRDHGKPR